MKVSVITDSVHNTDMPQAWDNHLLIQAVATTWFIYDYFLTFPNELRYIWWRNYSSVKLIFLFLRYAAFINLIKSIEGFVNRNSFPDDGVFECRIIERLSAVTDLVFYTSLTMLMAVRVYAISRRNIKASLSVLCLGIMFVICDGFLHFFGAVTSSSFAAGCSQTFALAEASVHVQHDMYIGIGISGTCCFFVAELIVQVYTWKSTWNAARVTRNAKTQRSLSFFLLRDGTIIWLVLTLWTIIWENVSSVDMSPLTVPFFSIMICRALIQLKQIKFSNDNEHGTGARSYLTARFIGNVGAPLDISGHQAHDNRDDNTEESTYVDHNPLEEGLQLAESDDTSRV